MNDEKAFPLCDFYDPIRPDSLGAQKNEAQQSPFDQIMLFFKASVFITYIQSNLSTDECHVTMPNRKLRHNLFNIQMSEGVHIHNVLNMSYS